MISPTTAKFWKCATPQQATRVLAQNMTVNLALPCRISVYQEGSKTKIGMVRPPALLTIFPGGEALRTIAEEVEQQTIKMIDEAK